MDPDTEIRYEYPGHFRVYYSGRIERFIPTQFVPASLDSSTAVDSKDVLIIEEPNNNNPPIAARLFLPINNVKKRRPLPILVYFHGGAFCLGSPFTPTYHSYLNSLVSQANIVAVSVDYRLATEHLLPAAYDDSWAALKWVLSPNSDDWLAEHGDYERVFLAGDSAGANIAHQMAMRLGAEEGMMKKIEGVALVHPFFWGKDAAVGSDIGRRRWIDKLWMVVNVAGVDVDDPWINPMAASLKGLGCQRAMVAVAEIDTLAERGRTYCGALKGSGWDGEVELVESEGEGHCFHLIKPDCSKALDLMAKLVAFFQHGDSTSANH